jgi:hypothetical protein
MDTQDGAQSPSTTGSLPLHHSALSLLWLWREPSGAFNPSMCRQQLHAGDGVVRGGGAVSSERYPHRKFAFGWDELIIGPPVESAAFDDWHYTLLSQLMETTSREMDPEEMLAGWLAEEDESLVVSLYGSRRSDVLEAFEEALRRSYGNRPITVARVDDWEQS